MSFFASLKTGEEEDLQKDDHVEDGEGGGRRREGEPGGAPETSPLPSPPLPTPARTHDVHPAFLRYLSFITPITPIDFSTRLV